eukprot:PhM_4_TR11641/c2_g2_i1/m.68197
MGTCCSSTSSSCAPASNNDTTAASLRPPSWAVVTRTANSAADGIHSRGQPPLKFLSVHSVLLPPTEEHTTPRRSDVVARFTASSSSDGSLGVTPSPPTPSGILRRPAAGSGSTLAAALRDHGMSSWSSDISADSTVLRATTESDDVAVENVGPAVRFVHLEDEDSVCCASTISGMSVAALMTLDAQSEAGFDVPGHGGHAPIPHDLKGYQPQGHIGHGRFARVLLGGATSVAAAEGSNIDIGSSVCAIRVTKRSAFRPAVERLRSLHHPCLVRTVKVFEDHRHDRYFIVSEHMAGGPLCHTPNRGSTMNSNTKHVIAHDDDDKSTVLSSHEMPSTIRTANTVTAFRDVLYALQYLHRKGVVHGNIRPENILVDSAGAVKLADPGLVLPLQSAFPAPEGPQLTRAADIWALGVTFFIALCGKAPQFVVDGDSYVLSVAALSGLPCAAEAGIVDVLRRMMHRDPLERISADLLLMHPVFRPSSSSAAVGGGVGGAHYTEGSSTTAKALLSLHIVRWKEYKSARRT